jgi:hypothetical protein
LLSGSSHGSAWRRGLVGRMFQKIADLLMPIEQGLDSTAHFAIAAASALQKGSAFTGRQLDGFSEDRHVKIEDTVHQVLRIVPYTF